MKTGILMVYREYRNSMQKGGSGWASKNNGGGGQPCKNNGGGLIVAKRARGCLAMGLGFAERGQVAVGAKTMAVGLIFLPKWGRGWLAMQK